MRYTIYMAGEQLGTCMLNAQGQLVIDSTDHEETIRDLIMTEFAVQENAKDFQGFFGRMNRYLRGYVSAVSDRTLSTPCDWLPPFDLRRLVQRPNDHQPRERMLRRRAIVAAH